MKYRRIILLFAVIFIIGAGFSATVINSISSDKLDTVAVNEILQSFSKQWEDLHSGAAPVFPKLSNSLDYTVLDIEGTLLASTSRKNSQTVNEAIANRDTIVDILIQNKPAGKLLIYNNITKRQKESIEKLYFILLAAMIAQILLFLGFTLYVKKTIFHPFKKLRNFAVRVAGGDFDMPLEMDVGNAFGAFTESFDLMREELKKAREQERAANKSKKELVAKLSHDIKTPVSSIKAVSELMDLSVKTEKEHKQIGVICKKADQIDSLITNLFHATLEELKELTVTPSEYESGLLTELIVSSDYLNMASIEMIPGCILLFDRLRLQQVLDNVFGNSYKYANTSILVSFSIIHNTMIINIKDFGMGIPQEELPLVFEKFYRGENAKDKNGAGLGLFIARYLMIQMGGSIVCQNSEEGFMVIITLQLAGSHKIKV